MPAAAAILPIATPAHAQEVPPPTVVTPPIDFDLPAATPTPRATETPRAAPTPRATPTPRPTPSPRRTPEAVETPTPAEPTPLPEETPEPAEIEPVAVPEPEATPEAEPTVVPEPATADPVPERADAAMLWWPWAAGAALLALLIGYLLGRGRRAKPVPVAFTRESAPPPPPAPQPEPVAARPAIVPAAPASAPTRPEDDGRFLDFSLRPLRVGLQNGDAVLDFDLAVGNATGVAAEEIRIATLMMSANPDQDRHIEQFLAGEGTSSVEAFPLAPGDGRTLEATMTLPARAINTVTTHDRPFFVPMIVVDARYRWADGRSSRTSAAFMVGPVRRPGDKLAPVFLDRGDRMADRVEARLHGTIRRS